MPATGPRDWNADSYQRVSAPLEQMGRDVLDRLTLQGDERVLDAGCGTGRVTVALLELELERPVDAVLSTATFHWIADHDRLFARLRAASKPGGRLVAQCGGEGNIAGVRAAIERIGHPALDDWAGPWHFASPRATHERLERGGFTDVWCWPQAVRVVPDDLAEYLSTVVLGSHLERLDTADREPFVEAVGTELGDDGIDYVRLNVLARS